MILYYVLICKFIVFIFYYDFRFVIFGFDFVDDAGVDVKVLVNIDNFLCVFGGVVKFEMMFVVEYFVYFVLFGVGVFLD